MTGSFPTRTPSTKHAFGEVEPIFLHVCLALTFMSYIKLKTKNLAKRSERKINFNSTILDGTQNLDFFEMIRVIMPPLLCDSPTCPKIDMIRF